MNTSLPTEAKYWQIMKSAIDSDSRPSFIVAGDQLVVCNRAAAEEFGPNRLGSVEEFFSPQDIKIVRCFLNNSRMTSRPGSVLARLKSAGGQQFTWRLDGGRLECPFVQSGVALVLRLLEKRAANQSFHALSVKNRELNTKLQQVREMRDELAGVLADFRGVFDNAAFGIALVGVNGECNLFNQKLYDVLQLENEAICQSRVSKWLDEHVKRLLHHKDFGDFDAGRISTFTAEHEFPGQQDDGAYWLRTTVSKRPSPDGEQTQLILVVEDVTQQKEAETTRNLLIGEMNHRVKNTLAVIQGVVQQSMATYKKPEAFCENLSARIANLSQSYDLLNQSDWNHPSLSAIIDNNLGIVLDTRSNRIRFAGTDPRINPKAAITVGMVFYELATNALKYGAFSNDVGTIEINSEIFGKDGNNWLCVKWKEVGGPANEASEREGFGSFMIRRGVQFSLGGQAIHELRPDGLYCEFSFPLDAQEKGKSKSKKNKAKVA